MKKATTKKDQEPHVIWKPPSTLACLHCGDRYDMSLPAPMTIVSATLRAFGKDHAKCKRSSRGPACHLCIEWHDGPCPATRYDGDWRKWLAGPDTGTSSKAICQRLAYGSDRPLLGSSPPRDPDDFGRCYRLLHAIPGWRARIGEMRDQPGWAPLVDAWDELERLYEQELPGGKAIEPEYERTPDGNINNCALANGAKEEDCQICNRACPDKGRAVPKLYTRMCELQTMHKEPQTDNKEKCTGQLVHSEFIRCPVHDRDG